MGRVFVIPPGALVALDAEKATAKLQKRSERRAIVDFVIDNGGKTTIDVINGRFGYDCRGKVQSLVRVGWLKIEQQEAATC